MHLDVGYPIAFADPRPGIEISVATLPSENGANFPAQRESNTLVKFSTVDAPLRPDHQQIRIARPCRRLLRLWAIEKRSITDIEATLTRA
jgi:hypothetical protein